jgi:hypothetical protein
LIVVCRCLTRALRRLKKRTPQLEQVATTLTYNPSIPIWYELQLYDFVEFVCVVENKNESILFDFHINGGWHLSYRGLLLMRETQKDYKTSGHSFILTAK